MAPGRQVLTAALGVSHTDFWSGDVARQLSTCFPVCVKPWVQSPALGESDIWLLCPLYVCLLLWHLSAALREQGPFLKTECRIQRGTLSSRSREVKGAAALSANVLSPTQLHSFPRPPIEPGGASHKVSSEEWGQIFNRCCCPTPRNLDGVDWEETQRSAFELSIPADCYVHYSLRAPV